MDRECKITTLIVAFFITISVLFVGISTNIEKNTFNKYKSPDMPPATFIEALCTQLRVTTN